MIEIEKPDKALKASFLAMRDEWIDEVNKDERLSHATTRVATFIALRINAQTQVSNWPVKKIAKEIPSAPGRKMSSSTITKAIAELVAANLLIVTRKGRRSNYVYAIHLPGYEFRKSLRDAAKEREVRKSNANEVRKSNDY